MHSVTTFYRAVIRMMELNEQSGPPVQQLDDSALAEELQIQVQQLIVQHPEIVPLPARVRDWHFHYRAGESRWTGIPTDSGEEAGESQKKQANLVAPQI